MADRDVIPGSAAAFGHDYFTIAHRQHWRSLRHREIDATVRHDAAGDRVQTTRIKVRGDAELTRRWEAHKALRQTRPVAVVEFAVFGADGIVILTVRAKTHAE